MITGKTIVCGVIGDPVEHSVSPAMQNAAFQAANLDFVYLPFRVGKGELKEAIAGLRALNFRGINVTIPHKIDVIPLLDEVDELANQIGAVNTIVNDGGKLTGCNTDADGFIRSLMERGIEPSGKRVLIIGAGGAARAVAFALMSKKSEITLINRSIEKATDLAAQLASHFKHTVGAVKLEDSMLEKVIRTAAIVVNTTSIGMTPNVHDTPVPANLLKKGTVVYDVVYNPGRTRLMREAESAGLTVIGGADMLAWQGALAFEKWTGQTAPVDLMKQEVYRQLEKG